jgi:hypothetical protein
MRNILLLTSTIAPKPDQPDLQLIDPAKRLEDYARSLQFQVELLTRRVVDQIIYVDNSGYNLSILKYRFPLGSIEWISNYDLDYDKSYHRGYGEFRLIDNAYRSSNALRSAADGDRVWKITGRYIVKNLKTVLALQPRRFDLYCDIKDNWADMAVIAWTKSGYEQYISGLWQHFATTRVPELIFAERLKAARTSASRIVTSWYWPPVIVGRRGSDGKPLQGRLTPLRFGINASLKAAQLPFRIAAARARPFKMR